MGQQPIKHGKRVLVGKSPKPKSLAKLDKKTRKEIGGTFGMQARRMDVDGSERNMPEQKIRYVSDAGRVVNFGGEVTAKGRFGREERAELLNLVENTGNAKTKKDPSDRVLRVKVIREGFVVYTSKPNLAVAIGKRLHRTRKGGDLTITWSRYDSPVRVVWRAEID